MLVELAELGIQLSEPLSCQVEHEVVRLTCRERSVLFIVILVRYCTYKMGKNEQ